MAEDNRTTELAKKRIEGLAGEVQTKALYIALALLFVADTAGVFAANIPEVIFVGLFIIAVGIDAYK